MKKTVTTKKLSKIKGKQVFNTIKKQTSDICDNYVTPKNVIIDRNSFWDLQYFISKDKKFKVKNNFKFNTTVDNISISCIVLPQVNTFIKVISTNNNNIQLTLVNDLVSL